MQRTAASRNVPLVYAFWFLRDFQLWIPVWIVFLTIERGFSLSEVTFAEGTFLAGVVLLEVPTGAVADRWGRSRSLALGATCLAAAVLIFAYTTSFAVLLASFWLWSLAATLMSGADNALLFDTLRIEGREWQFERIAGRGAAAAWTAAGIATFVGGPVAAWVDTRATIILGAATCLLAALVALALWEPPRPVRARREPYLRSIALAFREVGAQPGLRRTILLSGAVGASLQGAHYLVQPYLVDRGVSVGTLFSSLQVPLILAGAGGSLAAAALARRHGEARPLVVIPLLAVIAYAALAASPGLGAYPAILVIFALSGCLPPLTTGYVNRRVESERRATILSMQGMATSLSMAALVPGLGYVTDHWGLAQAFTAGGACALLALLAFGPRPGRALAAEAAESAAG